MTRTIIGGFVYSFATIIHLYMSGRGFIASHAALAHMYLIAHRMRVSHTRGGAAQRPLLFEYLLLQPISATYAISH